MTKKKLLIILGVFIAIVIVIAMTIGKEQSLSDSKYTGVYHCKDKDGYAIILNADYTGTIMTDEIIEGKWEETENYFIIDGAKVKKDFGNLKYKGNTYESENPDVELYTIELQEGAEPKKVKIE